MIDARSAAVAVLAWAQETGAVVATLAGTGVSATPRPPPEVAELLARRDVRIWLGAFAETAAENWPVWWRRATPFCRTFMMNRAAGRAGFTADQHELHDERAGLRQAAGCDHELADLLAVGDATRWHDKDEPAVDQPTA